MYPDCFLLFCGLTQSCTVFSSPCDVKGRSQPGPASQLAQLPGLAPPRPTKLHFGAASPSFQPEDLNLAVPLLFALLPRPSQCLFFFKGPARTWGPVHTVPLRDDPRRIGRSWGNSLLNLTLRNSVYQWPSPVLALAKHVEWHRLHFVNPRHPSKSRQLPR